MHLSLFASSAVGIVCALAPSWEVLLALRGLQGFALAGLPAVATAYLREEVHTSAASRATGLYIGGTALGGMSGRLIVGSVADVLGWRWATGVIGLLGLACAVTVLVLLPRSRTFRPVAAKPAQIAGLFRKALSDPALLALYGLSGTLMGGFVAVYNAMGFRLEGPPYGLPLNPQEWVNRRPLFTQNLSKQQCPRLPCPCTAAATERERSGRAPRPIQALSATRDTPYPTSLRDVDRIV